MGQTAKYIVDTIKGDLDRENDPRYSGDYEIGKLLRQGLFQAGKTYPKTAPIFGLIDVFTEEDEYGNRRIDKTPEWRDVLPWYLMHMVPKAVEQINQPAEPGGAIVKTNQPLSAIQSSESAVTTRLAGLQVGKSPSVMDTDLSVINTLKMNLDNKPVPKVVYLGKTYESANLTPEMTADFIRWEKQEQNLNITRPESIEAEEQILKDEQTAFQTSGGVLTEDLRTRWSKKKLILARKKKRLMRDQAGFLPPSYYLELAEIHGIPITKVHEYLKYQEKQQKIGLKLIEDFNIDANNEIFELAKNKLLDLEESGLLKPGTTLEWERIQRKASSPRGAQRYQLQSIGHFESLHRIFLRGMPNHSGNRFSNWDFEPLMNYLEESDDGVIQYIRGNKSRGATQDMPKYALRKLRGLINDPEDEFMQFALPELFAAVMGDGDPVVPIEWRSHAVREYFQIMGIIQDEISKYIDPTTGVNPYVEDTDLYDQLLSDASQFVTIRLTDWYTANRDTLGTPPSVTKKIQLSKSKQDSFEYILKDLKKRGYQLPD